MAFSFPRYEPNNGGYHDRGYHIDIEGFLQGTAISSRNEYSYIKGQTNVTATEQLSEESNTSNSQFFGHKSTTGNNIPLLNLDGNSSPQDDDFPALAGFQNARPGFNLPTAGARASRGPVSNQVHTQKWTGCPKPYHLLTPKELKALECLNGPPPGMPEHMIRPEDRKYCIFKNRNKGSKPSTSHPRTPQQQLIGTPSTPAAPKRKTKNRTHQLARPSGISKRGFDISGVRASTKGPIRDRRYLDAAQRDSPGGKNGFLANGMPRLPPVTLSHKAYRDLGTYALRHNGRIPFKKGIGLPSHGKLVYFGPGRLGVKLDRHSSPKGSHSRRGNVTSTVYQQQAAASAAEVSEHGYAHNITGPMLNNYPGFDNYASFGTNSGSTGSHTLGIGFHSMQAQAEVDSTMQDLGRFAHFNQVGSTAFAPQLFTAMPQDLLLQQPVQWQSPLGTPQDYSKQPGLSFPGFGNTPSTFQQMAQEAQRPHSGGLNDAMQLHGIDTIAGKSLAPALQRPDPMRRATSDFPRRQMQYPLSTAQDNYHVEDLRMYEPTPPPSGASSQHTTPQMLEESTLTTESNPTFEGEPVFEHPGGPMAGWLLEGHYYPFEATPTQAVVPTSPPEQRQEQQQQQQQQEEEDLEQRVVELADDNNLLPTPVTAAEGSGSMTTDGPSNINDDTANTTAADSAATPAAIPATEDETPNFEALTAQFLRDYEGPVGENEDELF